MKRSLSILLATGAFTAQAGIVTSAGFVADRSGTRIVLQATEEPLSRSVLEPDGTLRIELQGSRSTLEGRHAIPANPFFSSVQATNEERDGSALTVFRFAPISKSVSARVRHREWDGQGLAFLLEKEPAAAPMVDFWTVPVADVGAQQVYASLSVTPSLQEVRAWGTGDFETVEFKFPSPTLKAELVGSGKKFTIRLGKARLAGKLAPPASATSAAISPAGPPPIMAIFTRYLFIVTVKNHTGLIRPKSVRRGAFNVGLESTTYDRSFSRTNTTQCQNGRPCSRCHLMANNA